MPVPFNAVCYLLWLTTSAGVLPAADAPAASLPQATPVDGQPFAGTLQSVDAKWNLEFATPSGPRELAAANLVQWGNWREPADGPQVVLATGGVLVAAEIVSIGDDQLRIDSDVVGTVKLPLAALAGVILRRPTDRRQADRWEDRIASAIGDTDRVLLANGDELTGTITGYANRTLQIKAATGPLKIESTRLSAVIFNPALRTKAEPRGLQSWVGLRDGSRFIASSLVLQGKPAKLTLPGGVDLTAPAEAVVALLPIGGRAVYLSDLPVAGYKHIPYLDLAWDFRPDRSVSGSALRAAKQRHLKGLGLHSAARLTYNLDQPYRRFEAQLAIDDETDGQGSIVARVFVDDGNGKWQVRYESSIIRGGLPATPISVDLTSAKRLSLLVDFADRGDQHDHADWLEARLVK